MPEYYNYCDVIELCEFFLLNCLVDFCKKVFCNKLKTLN